MIRIGTLFESHLAVSDLRRSMSFYGDTLGDAAAGVVRWSDWKRRSQY